MKNSTPPAPAWATLAALAATGCGGGDDSAAEDVEAPGEPAGASALMDPVALAETAPETFQARFETSKGVFVIEVERAWAPLGADRFYALVKNGFYDGVRFFRVVEGFVAQFGIHGDPEVSAIWREAQFPDDSAVVASNTRGMVTYAMGSANSRTTQIFVNYGDNSRLDELGFAPFGRVVEGMEVLDQLHSGYGETPSRQNQPRIQAEGNAYLEEHFPELDYVVSATVVEPAGGP